MNGGIFLIQKGGELVEMTEQPYDTEDVLQDLLAMYPNLLAGDQMDPGKPRRWLLVSREMGVPDEEDGADRWSLDHLFLDQDAVPTLVEVKRSTDTRIRRDVVGQMLDYAANAVVYWPVETIRARFEQTCQENGAAADEVLAKFLEPQSEPGEFWQRVKTNLQAGRVRLVFVADEIPAELRRIVEFLNSQMYPAEALVVEVKQYVGQGLKTLVPRVIGLTAEAEGKKGAGGANKRAWDERSFFADVRERDGEKAAQAARKILDWAKGHGLDVWWGEGAKYGSFYPIFDYKGVRNWTCGVYTYGRVEMPFQQMRARRPFDEEAKVLEWCDRLNQIPGINVPIDAISRRPSIPLQVLSDDAAMRQFLGVLDWLIAEVKAAVDR
jgi:hypothetical protein